jgi:hypothetical protein
VHGPVVNDFAEVWGEWLGFLGLGAEGRGFMVE